MVLLLKKPMKKKSFSRKYKNEDEMDAALEFDDLSEEFKKKGVVKKPALRKIDLHPPNQTVEQIDRIAERLVVSRQPLLKIWFYERLKSETSS